MGRALWLTTALLLPACAPSPKAQPAENTGEAKSAVFSNGDFEAGTNNQPPPSWTVTTYLDPGVTIQSPQTRAGLNLGTGGTPFTYTLVTNAGPESQVDPTLGATSSFRWPKFGNAVAIVNQLGKNKNANSMKQTMTVAQADVDSIDGLAHVRFVLAPVLQDPGHQPEQQPYFYVQLTNLSKGNAILYQDYNFANQPGVPWKSDGAGTTYTDWALVDIAPGSANLAVGDQVELEIIASGCSQGGHWGQVYVDSVGSTVPGAFVSATGPASANDDTDITYTVTYKNGGGAPAAGTVVEFNTPPNTTFTSFNAPGLVCTAPPPGTGGLVTCIVGALPAGASGSFQVTVHIDPGTTGTITEGNYDITGTGISPLLGPKVHTDVTHGVTYADLSITKSDGVSTVVAGGSTTYTIVVTNAGPNDVTGATVTDTLPGTLTGATWTCAGTGSATCTASGSGSINDSVSIPVGQKVTYTLTATVPASASAGTLANIANVSVPSGASDPAPANNAVGDYDAITVANGVACTTNADCTSGVCDASDHKCGYAIGDGPCTTATAAAVCRSGACSVNGTCEPAGGCNVDGDCTGGNWCNESAHACTAKIPNGGDLPNDPPHTGPTLNGACSAAAAALVCASGVCDASDNKCGYANSDGPCTAADAATVCRSGACSVNGTCEPAGGCNVDGDCTGGNWCNESAHACTAKIPNGGDLPNDPPHTGPTLNGTCSATAAALVCASGVCDPTDNKCGFVNGDGPCTTANGGTVCRSGACSAGGAVCIPAGGCAVDADCSSAQWCNTQSFACVPKLPNGQSIPTVPGHTPPLAGACTAGAGAAVCVSGVCDTTDNECGFANNDGPCTAADAATVCRSGACSVNGTCEPAGGCNVDGDCTGGNWCNISAHTCAPKVANGGVLPSDPGHTGPVLNAKCTDAAAALVCVSGVCDTTDNRCGYANGDGTCTAANAATVCRSGACDPDSKCGYANGDGPCIPGNSQECRSSACSENGAVCVPVGGCAVDADCGAGEWCDSQAFTCKPKLPNGQPIPTVPGHTPPLAGACTTGAGAAVCASGVCDTADNLCGYANGDGPCTDATGAVVCRSGACGANGTCQAPVMCNADADCDTATQFCDTGAHACAPKLPNGVALPTVPGHTPALDGKCSTTEAPVVCRSGVCETSDNACGYANGDGPCTAENAGTVCRSSTCSPNAGVCVPSGGCAVDADCTGAEWCNTQTFTCTPKLDNGVAVPSVGGHTPALTGKCTPGAAAAVCASGVCDTADDKCGYANGDGPCTTANGAAVCRSAQCSQGGVCVAPADCTTDAQCDTATQYCNTGAGVCAPKLPNGAPLPVVPGHAPTLDGSCSDASAQIVCQSGVCDPADGKCGHDIGKGPCDAANGAVVCRSGECATSGPNQGLCVECLADAQCAGAQPVCDPTKNACVQCTSTEDAACSGATPVCTPGADTCAPCDGDLGSSAAHACGKTDAPFCFLTGASAGECGKCSTNADCEGHAAGPICDKGTGACGTACFVDADCDAASWCNAGASGGGMCVPKLDNGTALPSNPPAVAKCSDDVGKRVCKSGVCDPADDKCGLANGDGACTDGSVCRSGACDANDQKCGYADGDGPCTSDAVCRVGACDATKQVCNAGCKLDSDCPEGDFCSADGACKPKLGDGKTCTSANQCVSGACDEGVCDRLVAAGNGLICAAQPTSGSGEGAGLTLVGLMLATAGLARRRRR